MAGATLGFLRYNFPPARIFLGDAGSLKLGFLLAALGATIAAPGTSPTTGLAVALILGLPCCDFLLVHWRRYHDGVKNPVQILTSTGKDHLPHRLLHSGFSLRQVALWTYGTSALLGAGAVLLVLWGSLTAVILVMLLAVIAYSVAWSAGIVHKTRSGTVWVTASRAKRGPAPPSR
jgi:UDP-GlcNAc:undecaprenyl-phosphate GlcNAc-1-phosphate transferase